MVLVNVYVCFLVFLLVSNCSPVPIYKSALKVGELEA